MLKTYKGILRGDRIEWSDSSPGNLTPDHPVAVHVTILDEVSATSTTSLQGQRMVEALERIAAAGGVSDIADPAAWERDLRQDRPLMDRVD